MMSTYLDVLMMTYLKIHLELKIETQLGLLEEMKLVPQLAPFMVMDFWMGNSLDGLFAQN